MRNLLIVTVLSLFCSCGRKDDLSAILTREISLSGHYQANKEARIKNITDSLWGGIAAVEPRVRYDAFSRLYHEYFSFRFDSAFRYSVLMREEARAIGSGYEIDALTKYCLVLSNEGFFKEAVDSLFSVDIAGYALPDSIRAEYYIAGGRIYHNLADYTNESVFSEKYNTIGNDLLEKGAALVNDSATIYWLRAKIALKRGEAERAKELFEYAMDHFQMSEGMSAIMLSTLGFIENRLGNYDKAITLYTLAAINNIQNVTKESVALRGLANVLFSHKKEVDKASEYIGIALEDAQVYGARHRKIVIGALLPMIVGEKLNVIQAHKNRLVLLVVIITALSAVLLAAMWIVIRQKREIGRSRDIIQKTNEQLSEANMIKDNYLGHYFVVSAELADMIDRFLKVANRKIDQKQYESLAGLISNLSNKYNGVNYKDFDKIFVTIFPTFVDDFNALLRPEDRITLADKFTLTPTLRIFALIRLGITDSETISKILNYSLNTIYNYRTRIRQKALGNREQFEERVRKIGI